MKGSCLSSLCLLFLSSVIFLTPVHAQSNNVININFQGLLQNVIYSTLPPSPTPTTPTQTPTPTSPILTSTGAPTSPDCGCQNQTHSANFTREVLVGGLFPLTKNGVAKSDKHPDILWVRAVRYVIQFINEEAIRLGNPARVTFVEYDTNSTSSGTKKAYENRDPKIKIFIGPISTEETFGIVDLIPQHPILVLSMASSTSLKDIPNLILLRKTDDDMAKALVSNLGGTKRCVFRVAARSSRNIEMLNHVQEAFSDILKTNFVTEEAIFHSSNDNMTSVLQQLVNQLKKHMRPSKCSNSSNINDPACGMSYPCNTANTIIFYSSPVDNFPLLEAAEEYPFIDDLGFHLTNIEWYGSDTTAANPLLLEKENVVAFMTETNGFPSISYFGETAADTQDISKVFGEMFGVTYAPPLSIIGADACLFIQGLVAYSSLEVENIYQTALDIASSQFGLTGWFGVSDSGVRISGSFVFLRSMEGENNTITYEVQGRVDFSRSVDSAPSNWESRTITHHFVFRNEDASPICVNFDNETMLTVPAFVVRDPKIQDNITTEIDIDAEDMDSNEREFVKLVEDFKSFTVHVKYYPSSCDMIDVNNVTSFNLSFAPRNSDKAFSTSATGDSISIVNPLVDAKSVEENSLDRYHLIKIDPNSEVPAGSQKRTLRALKAEILQELTSPPNQKIVDKNKLAALKANVIEEKRKKRSGEADDLKEVPGAATLGKGYDIVKGFPDPFRGDKGILNPIIIFNLKTATSTCTVKGNVYKVAANVQCDSAQTRCQGSSETVVINNVDDYQKNLAINLDVDLDGSFGAFSLNANYRSTVKTLTEKKTRRYENSILCEAATVTFQQSATSGYELNSDFVSDFKNLPATHERNRYVGFVKKWGTHIITKVVTGGAGQRFQEISEINAQKLEEQKIDVKASYNKKFSAVDVKLKGSVNLDTTTSNKLDSNTDKTGFAYFGGASGVTVYDEWLKTLPGNEGALRHSITILSDYFQFDTRLRAAAGANFDKKIEFLSKSIVDDYGKGVPLAPANVPLGKVSWPPVSFTIPAPSGAECPSAGNGTLGRWEKGTMRVLTEVEDNRNTKEGFVAGNLRTSSDKTKRGVDLYFCTFIPTTRPDKVESFPAGKYCFYQRGADCPAGFFQSSRYQDADNLFREGVLPLGGTYPAYTSDQNGVEWNFCCRDDGDENDAIEFYPMGLEKRPFYLLRKGGACQKVFGFTLGTGSIFFDDENDDNQNKKSGTLPSGYMDWNTWLDYCYYY